MFEALFSQATAPITVISTDEPVYTVVAANEQYKHLSNYSGDIIGKPVTAFLQTFGELSDEYITQLKNGLYKAASTGQQVDLPAIHIGNDVSGGKKWQQLQVTPVINAGNVDYLMCIMRHVTENELLKKDLHQLQHEINSARNYLDQLNTEADRYKSDRTNALDIGQHYMRSVLDALPHIAWTNDADGNVTFYNKRWYEYTGLTPEKVIEEGWINVIHPDDVAHCVDSFRQALKSGEPSEYEVREKGADGIYRWYLVRINAVMSPSGDIDHWLGTATDIDSIKQLEQQKDDFISIASHELKTPITSLKASLQLLDKMKGKQSVETIARLISQSRKSAQRIGALVEDLLNMSKLRHNEIKLNKKVFVMSELLNACCNPVSIMGKHAINITGDLTLKVLADESSIDQVVVNLLNNAVKYAAQSSKINFNIEKDGKMVKISISDDGPGIPRDVLPHLFNRYYRVRYAGYQASGLGLGLYICAEIIKRHGGVIDVKSELGRGSTFWFTLPMA